MAAVNSPLSAGRPWPLGATVQDGGVNFALFSQHARRVDLCLIDREGERTLTLLARSDGVWHGFVAGIGAGQRYAYRVWGPPQPTPGDAFDPTLRLLDPAARALIRDAPDASGLLGLVVAEPSFDWGDDRPPATPWSETLLYEVHVRGQTRRHPDVAPPQRGTYAGLASPAMLAHYRRLGITALSLLPVQQHLDEPRLTARGLRNYWGYNPINFFAPEPAYAVDPDPLAVADEFRTMVRALHAAGLEVILDVVFNHTAESDAAGPTRSWRGIDNRSYYHHDPAAPGRYDNLTGCGNALNLAHPRVLQQVMDALRHWRQAYRVDGFRFDLAVTLTRDSGFLAAVAQEPLLQGAKLIAEPWDLGLDGYRLGRFPPGWHEWNDRFRDDVRAFWLTGQAGVGALAQRLAGSSELFRAAGRPPQAGINYVAVHDGFTLRDLVSYRHKHNEANGEANRDGSDENFSTNLGVEGDTADPLIGAARCRRVRALLATLFVAQGVPMLQAGDELGRTQHGNNNAYCQDNELTWLDWDAADTTLIEDVAALAALRQQHPALRRQHWLRGAETGDCRWLHPAGRELSAADWQDAALSAFGLMLTDDAGQAPVLVLINRAPDGCSFTLPAGGWRRLLDTSAATPFAAAPAAGRLELPGESVLVLAPVADAEP